MNRLIAVAMLVGIVSCNDATGPSMPDSLRPQFQKVVQDGVGGGGGSGTRSNSACEFPTHMSGPCVSQTFILGGSMITQLGACRTLSPACMAATANAAAQWNNWSNTPDANGHTHTYSPNEYYGGPMAPVGGPRW